MPLLDSDQPDFSDNGLGPARIPTMQQPAAPGFLDVAAAAERQNNIVSQVYNRMFVQPDSDAAAEPGFNPIDHIPAGYAKHYGTRFLDATNPSQVQVIKGRIDSELQDQQTLARAHGYGIAASFAAGSTDPLTLASMALIPEAAPTRLGNAVRWALTNAATTAGQEVLSSNLQETRTLGQSALNVAAGAVLGGILGSFARRVPAAEFDRLRTNLAAELKPDGGEAVLGPQQRSILDEIEPQSASARYLAGEANTAIQRRADELRQITTGEEARAVAMRGDAGETSARLAAAKEGLQKDAEFLTRPRDEQVAEEAERLAKQDQENLYAIGRAREAGTPDVVHPSVQARAETMVDILRANAEKKVEIGRNLVGGLSEDVERATRVQGAESDLSLHEETLRTAKTLDEALETLPKEQADALRRRLELNETPAHTLDREGNLLEPKETPSLPEEAQHAIPGEPAYVNPNTESTAGAAEAPSTNLEDFTVGRGGETLAKTIGKVAPAARVLTRPSLVARKIIAQLVNIPGTLAQNYRGIANENPIERMLWREVDGTHMQGLAARKAAYQEYLQRVQKAGETPMPRRAFMDNITAAMRRGDKSAIPEVTKAAQDTRRIVFEPLFKRAKELGLLPDEATKFADSYMTRQYNAVKIRQNMDKWMELLRSHFMAEKVPGEGPAMSSIEATELAHSVTRNVMGSERGTMDWHALGSPKVTKDRKLSLPDTALEPFLTSDIDHLSHSYLRTLAPEVAITERFGSRDMADQMQDITDDYARMIEKARADGDVDQMGKLDSQRDKDIRDISAMRDRLYGTYGAPKDPGSFFIRAGRLARSFNVMRLLGGATLSHFPDLANVMMRYGMPNTFAALGKMMTSMDAIKLSLSEAQRMGAAIDMTMNMSASLLGDYGSHSQYLEQRMAAKVTKFFTIATGETPLITMTQALTSTLAQDELLRSAQLIARGGTIEGHAMARLASAGIDKEMLQKIAEQSANHVQNIRGLQFGMSDKWADQGVAAAFESAVLREAHGVTLRPGVGDTPLLMSSELGKLILQFKTFAFAANRVVGGPLAQGIAHGDIRSMTALMGLASMGGLSYVAKQKASGQPLESDPARLALEVLDKSNLLGWTAEAIYPALWQAGFKNLSRWSDRDPVETLGGPTLGTAASAYEREFPARLAPSGWTHDDLPFRRSDLHFARRMGPAQNLWYARGAMNNLEDSVGDLFDLPGTSNKERADQELIP